MNEIEREILQRFRSLPLEKQRQVRDFIARLAASGQAPRDIREYALDDWLLPEEDAAWEHFQRDSSTPQTGHHVSLPGGTTAKDLATLAGTISPEDLDLMERAIEEDCERIDLEGWQAPDPAAPGP